jgi:hypothetical protein
MRRDRVDLADAQYFEQRVLPTAPRSGVHRAQRRSRRAPAHRRECVVRAQRIAVERLAQQRLDDVGQVVVLEALASAFDLDEIRRELDAFRADRAHRGAQKARLVACGAAKQQTGVFRLRLREHLE